MSRYFLVAYLISVLTPISSLHANSELHRGNGDAFIEVITEDWRPYNFVHDGKLEGTSVEIMRSVLAHAKIDYRMTVMPWPRAYMMAQKNPNHMIFTMKRIAEREKYFVWGRPLVIGGEIYPYRLKERKDVTIQAIDDLKKYDTATIRDSFEDSYFKENGLSGRVTYATSMPSLFAMLNRNRVDYFLIQKESFPFEAEKAGVSKDLFVHEPFAIDAPSMYFAFNPKTQQWIIDRILRSFDHLKAVGKIP